MIFFSAEDSAYYAHVFTPGNVESVFGYDIRSQLHYWAICHNHLVDELELYEPYAAALGYRKLPDDKAGQFTFRTKEQVYRFLRYTSDKFVWSQAHGRALVMQKKEREVATRLRAMWRIGNYRIEVADWVWAISGLGPTSGDPYRDVR